MTLVSGVISLAGAIRDKLNAMNNSLRPSTVNVVVDGGGSAITSGIKADIAIPFDCTITQWTVVADQSGSIQFDLWKTTYANFPPNVGNSISPSAKPSLSSSNKAQSSTLTGWTTTVAAGDVIRVNVDSATTVQRVTLALKLQRV